MQLPAGLRQTAAEFDAYYSRFDPETQRLLPLVQRVYEKHQNGPPCLLKAALIECLCEETALHLFEHSPFFFEMASGRGRYSWGGLQSEIGSFLQNISASRWLVPFGRALAADRENGLIHNWDNPVGFDHHCPGYDRLLTLGLPGILALAEEALRQNKEPDKAAFLQAALQSNRALLRLVSRFAAKAKTLAAAAQTEEKRAHFAKIAQAAENLTQKAPQTFYEGLCLVLFYRECVGSVEGVGFSTFGHLDRLLFPFYAADLQAQRLTEAEAEQLIHTLFVYTEVRFSVETGYHETSTTILLGGCDCSGAVVYNALTELFLRVLLSGRYGGTKVNCRISKAHPKAYFRLLAEIQAAGIASIVMQNDDVLIPARVKQGQAEADARLYVSGGCHEIVLANTEVNTRADTWVSLPAILRDTLAKGGDFADFASLYSGFLHDAFAYYEKITELKNQGEEHWKTYAPLPLYSSTITGCLETGRDITEGGAKYSSTAISLVGAATVIDSLYSLYALVFEEKRLSLTEFRQILAENFTNNEPLRQYIINRVPKYGTNHPKLNAFGAKVLADLSRIAGQENARGGRYLPAFYPHDIFRPLGEKLGATPDGRKAGLPLSRGASPSEFVETESPADLLKSLAAVDFTAYADSFCAEVTLPSVGGEKGILAVTALMEVFLAAEGSSLQINTLDRAKLLAAQKNPEAHRDILVRVCGYSAAFVHLSRKAQDEIIGRAIR